MENEQKPARPWDLWNKEIGRVETEVADQRMSICHDCTKFIKLSGQCKECGCIMKMKTKLPNASCPLGKWGIEKIEYRIGK